MTNVSRIVAPTPPWEPLEALLTASPLSRSLQSSKIWSSELSRNIILDFVLKAHGSELQKLDFISLLASSPLSFFRRTHWCRAC